MNLLAAAPVSLRNVIWGVNIAGAAFLVIFAILAILARRRRPVYAPNQTIYHDDDTMEGFRLDRMLAWVLGIVAVVAVSLPVYWLIEPERQEAMDDQFLETSIEQGAELFESTTTGTEGLALGCADCHGPEGQGGATSQIVSIPRADLEVAGGALQSEDRSCAPDPANEANLICRVSWEAPALDSAFLRFSRDEIVEIVTYGRAGTPMPAWGLAGGGAKNEQSVDNIVDFIESIQISADEAKAQQADLTDGRALFEANCARCHTKHWSYRNSFTSTLSNDDPSDDVALLLVPGGGAFGPNLTGGVTLRQFPDIEDHVAFILSGSDFQAPYGTRGIGSGRMPGYEQMLTLEQIRAITEYERSLTDAAPAPYRPATDDSAEGEGA